MGKKIKRFDVIVIGSGSGLEISSQAAEMGLKTAVVEKGPFGGTCLNRGCIPSKILIHSADVAETIKNSSIFGVNSKITGINWKKIQERVWKVIDKDAKEIEQGNRENKNMRVYKTESKFVAQKTLEVGKELITADKIFICAGTRPSIPPIKGLDKIRYYTSDDVMRLKKQPSSMIIIGGGYIAAEMAHFFSSLGTKVTIVARSSPLIRDEDKDIAETFTEIVSKKYKVMLDTDTLAVNKKGNKIEVEVQEKDKKQSKKLEAEILLIATGRVPNTDILQVEKTGIKTNKNGFVAINEYTEASVPGVYAIGDIAGIYLFKHSANLEASYSAYNAFVKNQKEKIKVDYRAMPHAIFSSPQVSAVGMTEQELQDKKIKYAVGKYNYHDTAMGLAIEDKEGFVKILVEPKTRKILGCHILGTDASTLIHEVIVVMKAGLGVSGITGAVHVHPALSEVIQRAFESVEY